MTMPIAPLPPATANPADTAAGVAVGKKNNNILYVAVAVVAALIADLIDVAIVVNVIGGLTESVGNFVLGIVKISTPHQLGSLVLLAVIAGFAIAIYALPKLQK